MQFSVNDVICKLWKLVWTRSDIRSCLLFTFLEFFSGNNGQTPIDSIDQCCEHHDNCYDNVMNTGNCDLPHPMLVSYNWSLVNSDYSDDGVTLVCDDCATSPGLESYEVYQTLSSP